MGKKNPLVLGILSPTPLEEDRATAIGNMHKIGNDRACGWEICSRTDRQRDTPTCSLQYFATARSGEVKILETVVINRHTEST